MNIKFLTSNKLFVVGVIFVLLGFVFGWKKSEGFHTVSGGNSGKIVFRLKKPNGRYLSLCYNCFGRNSMILCERGVGVNFVKVPAFDNKFYIMVDTPSGLGYLKVGEDSLLYVVRMNGSLFSVTNNQDHTVSLKVMMDEHGKTGYSPHGNYIQKCEWLNGGGLSSPRETSVGCTSNLICVAGDTVCDANKYIVEMNNNWTYN